MACLELRVPVVAVCRNVAHREILETHIVDWLVGQMNNVASDRLRP